MSRLPEWVTHPSGVISPTERPNLGTVAPTVVHSPMADGRIFYAEIDHRGHIVKTRIDPEVVSLELPSQGAHDFDTFEAMLDQGQ